MSSDEKRITPDELNELAETRDIASLTLWEEDPYGAGDIGAETVAQARLGQTEHVLVHGDLVLWGGVMVAAEHHQPLNGGTVSVIDVAAKGWTLSEAKAEVLRRFKRTADIMVDANLLAELVTQLHAEDAELLAMVGWDGDDIDALLEQIERDEKAGLGGDLDGDADAIPEERAGDPIAQVGEVWQLGHHRVMCGSSTSAEDLAGLMAGTKADAMITDPPYGVDYGDTVEFRRSLGKTQRPADNSHVANDGLTEAIDLWAECFPAIAGAMADRSAFYCWSPPGDQQIDLGLALREAGFETHGTIIWVKSSFSFSRADHKYQHEPAFYGWPTKAVHDWHGPNNESTIWEYDKPHASPLHPTQKPVELIQRCVRNITERGDTILDPFLGSGTTLIAAEAEGRVCYGMELKPAYVDVICARWEGLTGIKPVRASTGEPVSFLESAA